VDQDDYAVSEVICERWKDDHCSVWSLCVDTGHANPKIAFSACLKSNKSVSGFLPACVVWGLMRAGLIRKVGTGSYEAVP
jgi:hypothetical protein